jgi:DNA topoisomerase-1
MRSATVLKTAIDRLNEALVYLKKKEKEIGHHLTEAITMTRLQQQQRQHQQTTLGACPVCRDGLLRIIRSSRTKKRFIGCSNYTSGKCKAAAALPQIGSLLSTGKKCSVCKWPILMAAHLGQDDLREFCINGRCPKKKAR